MSKSKEQFMAMREAEQLAYDYIMRDEYARIESACNAGCNSGMREMFNKLYNR